MTTLVILSGAYIATELIGEFGRLPACFLPNGTRRLYQAQIEAWKGVVDRVVVTLPDDYAVPEFDRKLLGTLSAEIFRTPASVALNEAIVQVVDGANISGRVLLLFGDTMVYLDDPSVGPDMFAVGESPQLALWATYERDQEGLRFVNRLESGSNGIVAGFFDLSDADLLAQSMNTGNGFYEGLSLYSAKNPLHPVATARWLDFGHLFSYHYSRRMEFDARSFNSIKGDKFAILKTGTPTRKIFAEAEWYGHLPTTMRLFCPQYLGFEPSPVPGYRVEYLYLPILSELFTYAELPINTWGLIFDSCREFLETCHSHRPRDFELPMNFADHFFDDIFRRKTFRRVEQFVGAVGLSMDVEWRFAGRPQPTLRAVLDTLIAMIAPTTGDDIRLWHGDFHFANLFFDFRSRRIKAVDPRGMLSDGSLSIYGDRRYDLAKLGHSVVGLYDLIIADRFDLTCAPYDIDIDFGGAGASAIATLYAEMRIGDRRFVDREIVAMIALLFFSMIPLHESHPRRQWAMLANGFRLFDMAKEFK